MDYDSHTLIQLKTMCKERGLRVSGNKNEVIIRLMEDDESKSPQLVAAVNPYQQMQPVNQIFITNNNSNASVYVVGIFIIIYGIFRVGMAVLFGEFKPAQSSTAFLIGMGYIMGGIITVQGYKQGLYMTMIVLVISGMFSIIYHDEFSPLSMGMDGIWPIEFSLICSASCMLFVAIPLLGPADTQFKEGGPPYLSALWNAGNMVSPLPIANQAVSQPTVATKTVINCPECDKAMKVPSNYTGSVKCPSCKSKFKVN